MAGTESSLLGPLPGIQKASTSGLGGLPSLSMGGGRGAFFIDDNARKNNQKQLNALNEFDNMELGASMKVVDPNEGKSMQEMWKLKR